MLVVTPRAKMSGRFLHEPRKTWGYIAYYPSYNKVMIRVDLSEMSGVEKVTAGMSWYSTRMAKRLPMGSGAGKANRRDHADSTQFAERCLHRARNVARRRAPEKPFEKTFTRKHFPWEENILGISDKVFTPFTPIAVQGNAASVVQRTYRMNGFGLWDSIVSKGREILAGPMTIDYMTAAGKAKWSGAKGAFVKSAPAQAVFKLLHKPCRAGENHSTLEYDGCMKVELELQPGAVKQTINSLWINIPLQKCRWRPSGTCAPVTPFAHPTGDAPQGNGVVWDSTQ